MLFSVITPCYKSTKTLRRTYESLLAQSEKDFEWILVDDASPDNGETKKLILDLVEDAPFSVKYIFLTENHFGSKSVYTASLQASGDFICILDHDDELSLNALSEVKELIIKYDVMNNERLAGVCGRCVNEKGQLIGHKFSEDAFEANEGDIRFKSKITCELFQFTKAKLIRMYFGGMKPGYTNGYCWAKISENFNYIYSNSIFRVYDTYNPESYSNKYKKIVVYPESKREATRSVIISYQKYLAFNIIYSLRLFSSFIRHSLLSHENFLVGRMPVLFYVTLPIALPLGWLKSKNII